MLQRISALYCLALTIPFFSRAQLQSIGQWRDHLPYQQVTGVACTNDKIRAFTPYNIFSIEPGDNTIERWSNNALVKITELDGRLVYETMALGGQVIRNGKDYKGRTISTGIYLVLVSDDTHQQKLVTKIVFVQK